MYIYEGGTDLFSLILLVRRECTYYVYLCVKYIHHIVNVNLFFSFFVINNKKLYIIYLFQYGTIFVKQNYFAHVIFINEQRDCDVANYR